MISFLMITPGSQIRYQMKPNMDDSGTWSVIVGDHTGVVCCPDKDWQYWITCEFHATSLRHSMERLNNINLCNLYKKSCVCQVKTHYDGLLVKGKLWNYPKLCTVYTILRNICQSAKRNVSQLSTPSFYYQQTKFIKLSRTKNRMLFNLS